MENGPVPSADRLEEAAVLQAADGDLSRELGAGLVRPLHFVDCRRDLVALREPIRPSQAQGIGHAMETLGVFEKGVLGRLEQSFPKAALVRGAMKRRPRSRRPCRARELGLVRSGADRRREETPLPKVLLHARAALQKVFDQLAVRPRPRLRGAVHQGHQPPRAARGPPVDDLHRLRIPLLERQSFRPQVRLLGARGNVAHGPQSRVDIG
mmetsp:Transcript_29350/g.101262  ORF Transcript_29350/g.101262 Transcript_29350/m.101262 type:complete len:210 (+) Transcript_29350:997-1626(+)